MEKESRLLMAQVDHVSGEVLGFAVQKIMELGAHNVQLVPTITKKNRPGNIILIDADASLEDKIAFFLAKEMRVSGYHMIRTSHKFNKVSFVDRTIRLIINGDTRLFNCRFKIIGELSDPITVDIEHDFLVELQKAIVGKWESYLSLDEIRNKIESSFEDSGEEITINLNYKSPDG
ncbi:MAG: DUF111 family protein [Nitrospirota bacterium]|jgi:hypothetical protein